MVFMNYFFSLILVFLVLGVVALSVVSVPYQGVVVLMVVSFFCCIFMVFLGRTFAALVMYIVYLGGLIVVFGYCVSVEKDSVVSYVYGAKYYVCLFLLVVVLWWFLGGWAGGLLVYANWEDVVCLEVSGATVLYSYGGAGLIMCSWGLLVVLFSILIILGWSRLGGFRPF